MSQSSDAAIPFADMPVAPSATVKPRAWRLLLRAFLWLLGAEAVAICGGGLIAFIGGFSRGFAKAHGGIGWQPDPLVYVLVGTLALQATLLFVSLRQGRSLGHGNLAAGLGAGPMRRHGFVALLAGLAVIWIGTFVAILAHMQSVSVYVSDRVPAVLKLTTSAGPFLLAMQFLLIVPFAPIVEELFFRGWLWTALRRSWGVWPTAVCTAGLWLAVHAIDAPARVLMLLPMAVLLSLARHYGNSVRASLVVHLVNNGVAAMIQFGALVFAVS